MIHTRTKIVCTLGPSSEKESVMRKMIASGMNVARLNFSHGTHENHGKLIRTVRKISEEVAILADLQGPRFRLGKLSDEGVEVHRDQVITLGKRGSIPTEVDLSRFVKKNGKILIHDGLVEVRVLKIQSGIITGRVLRGNILFSHKGINIPGIPVRLPVITPRDREDLAFALRHGVDFVALSFVRDEKDIFHLRKLIGKKSVKIIAKIERLEAIKNFDGILQAADGIMVARGDLGIEIPPEKVPLLQKDMIEKCLHEAKPVIVATQMLDSMIRNPRPTRAEVSDVSNAVIDHADALMLSGETAFGAYPVESVSMMKRIIHETEKSHFDDMPAHAFVFRDPLRGSLAQSVFELVGQDNAKAVIVNSLSGETARIIASYRPETKIIALTNTKVVIRQLALSWGVIPLSIQFYKNLDALINNSLREVKKKKLGKKGQIVVIVSGQPTGSRSKMNLLKVQTL